MTEGIGTAVAVAATFAAKKAGAKSGSHAASMAHRSRAYCLVVVTSSLKTTQSTPRPLSTLLGWMCTWGGRGGEGRGGEGG